MKDGKLLKSSIKNENDEFCYYDGDFRLDFMKKYIYNENHIEFFRKKNIEKHTFSVRYNVLENGNLKIIDLNNLSENEDFNNQFIKYFESFKGYVPSIKNGQKVVTTFSQRFTLNFYN